MMNASGNAAVELKRAYNVQDPGNLLVVYDELDLPVGLVRVRDKGSSGGHNGMKSIMDRLGTQEIARVRIGIGRPPPGEDPIDYVLTTFRPEEKALVDEAIRYAADAVEAWVELGAAETMNRFNALRGGSGGRSRAQAPAPKDAPPTAESR